jgi:hypothetical protein
MPDRASPDRYERDGDDPMSRRSTVRSGLVLGAAGAGIAVAAVGVGFGGLVHDDTRVANVTIVFIVVAMLGVGGLLATRVPHNPVAWLLLLTGLVWAGLAFSEPYARHGIAVVPGSLPGATLAYWFATWLWIPGLAILPALALPLFPNGRLPSPAWRPVFWSAGAGLGLVLLAQWTVCWGEPPCYSYDFALDAGDNPLHIPGLELLRVLIAVVGWVLLGLGFVGALVSSVVRVRGTRGDERRQMKWVVFGVTAAFSLYLVGAGILALLEAVAGFTPPFRLEDLFVLVALAAFPVTIALAVLKYRLYDIDRVISRTVAYAVVTVVLAAIYVSAVVVLGATARSLTGGGSELAVAASTLLAAAAFRPVRRWTQGAVDRRFNRARYDAQQTIEAFAQRLRDEVDLDALAHDLGHLVASTVRPSSVSVWLRQDGGTPDFVTISERLAGSINAVDRTDR